MASSGGDSRRCALGSLSQHPCRGLRGCEGSPEDDYKMWCMTANLIRLWFQRVEHVRQYALGVAPMIVEDTGLFG
ncbi:hypothetical protein TcYC6_0101950 [Trypanosoma cruzi]|nr:hypothetical protein TcYC6_0101950 [Trypanosoma cruzi]